MERTLDVFASVAAETPFVVPGAAPAARRLQIAGAERRAVEAVLDALYAGGARPQQADPCDYPFVACCPGPHYYCSSSPSAGFGISFYYLRLSPPRFDALRSVWCSA